MCRDGKIVQGPTAEFSERLPGWVRGRDDLSVGTCLWLPLRTCFSLSHPWLHNPLPRIVQNVLICMASHSATQRRVFPYCPPKGPCWKIDQTIEERNLEARNTPLWSGKKINPTPGPNWQPPAHEQQWQGYAFALLALFFAAGIVLILQPMADLEKHSHMQGTGPS